MAYSRDVPDVRRAVVDQLQIGGSARHADDTEAKHQKNSGTGSMAWPFTAPSLRRQRSQVRISPGPPYISLLSQRVRRRPG